MPVVVGVGGRDVQPVVRSDAGQWMRRSRSPGWNGRIDANSAPLPTWGERLTPISPGACTAGAVASNRAGSGRTSSCVGCRTAWQTDR